MLGLKEEVQGVYALPSDKASASLARHARAASSPWFEVLATMMPMQFETTVKAASAERSGSSRSLRTLVDGPARLEHASVELLCRFSGVEQGAGPTAK